MQSKGQIIQGLALALERGEWQFLDNKVATGELESFEQKVTRTGNVSYSAPEGLKDDTCIARALMVYNANQAQLPFVVIDDD
jgi:hypothetical protein